MNWYAVVSNGTYPGASAGVTSSTRSALFSSYGLLTTLSAASFVAVLKRYNGAAWVKAVLKRYNGASWVQATLKIYKDGSWGEVDTGG